MNILILEEEEVGALIPRTDRRWEHVKKILKKEPGDSIAAGIADGPLGRAVLRSIDDKGLILDFNPTGEAPPLAPLRIILGFPRPIQAARILKELTSLGVEEIILTGTDLGEKSYAQSSIFKNKEFRGPLLEGAEQAGSTRLPRVSTAWSLRRCLESIDASNPLRRCTRIFLHPYGNPERMSLVSDLATPLTLAIGSERGWTDAEIAALQNSGFVARGLGDRILKTETAVLAGAILALAKLGYM